MTQYIVLCGQFYGSPEVGYELLYNFDGHRFRKRETAIRHGLEVRGSDDFNIGVLEKGQLVSMDWMNETIDRDPAKLKRIAEQIGL